MKSPIRISKEALCSALHPAAQHDRALRGPFYVAQQPLNSAAELRKQRGRKRMLFIVLHQPESVEHGDDFFGGQWLLQGVLPLT